tara:strand:- start:5095 stop:5739 length:645 start_codon:yes stop_codon:yes gene_type:complete
MFKSILKITKMVIVFSLLSCVVLLSINATISNTSEHKTFDSVEDIPENRVGLLLGTGKYTSSGNLNQYYTARLQAAIKLHTEGKIEYILVSGDNSRIDYDEPSMFKEDLILAGIPENCIVLDYAGFRTLDSVLRAHDVFGLTEFTVISQKFHNERAIYLAEKHNLKVVGFNATAIEGTYAVKTNVREYAARVKAFIDIGLDVQPKFLGPNIEID